MALVWYSIEEDEIFLHWKLDAIFYGLVSPFPWDKYECLGEL